MTFEHAQGHDGVREHLEGAVPGAEVPGKRTRTQGLGPSIDHIADRVATVLQRRADGNAVSADAGDAVAATDGATGAPLPEPVRERFESSLGADLSGVRVHTGAESQTATAAVGARAYATGNDIHFGAGNYRPEDPFGLHLLAHEVAHTVQQSGGAARAQFKLEVSTPGDAHEVEADRAADAMVQGLPAAVSGGGAGRIMRDAAPDLDTRMTTSGEAAGNVASHDAEVRTISSHTTVSDQAEASSQLKRIQGAQSSVEKLSKEDDKFDYLKDNAGAAFALSQYLTSVTDVGDVHGQFASSYAGAKKDHGEFIGAFAAFKATGHKLDAHGLEKGVDALVRKDPAFAAVLEDYKKTRNELATDTQSINKHRDDAQTAKFELSSKLHEIRAKAAGAKADKKQAQLTAVLANIDAMTSTIMTVGKMAMSAVTGMIAMGDGAGGIDFSKMTENPQIEPGAAPAPAAAPAVNPNSGAREIDPDAKPAAPAAAAPAPEHTGFTLPSSTLASVKEIGGKGLDLAGGPEKLIKGAITELEKADIQGLKAQIVAAKEDAQLEQAASMADSLEAARNKYKSAILQVQGLIEAMMKHKANLTATTDRMKRLSHASGDKSDMLPALRLVTLGDRFIAQAELAINVGGSEATEANRAVSTRGKITGDFAGHHDTGEPQKRYWTARQVETGIVFKSKQWVREEHKVELKSAGKDSVFGFGADGNVQAVGDTKAGIKQLEGWKADVTTKRDEAQKALGLEAAVASTKAG